MSTVEIKANVKYTLDYAGTSVIHSEGKSKLFIHYPEAAVWNLIASKYSYTKMILMLRFILDLENQDVEEFVNNTLVEWHSLEIIDIHG